MMPYKESEIQGDFFTDESGPKYFFYGTLTNYPGDALPFFFSWILERKMDVMVAEIQVTAVSFLPMLPIKQSLYLIETNGVWQIGLIDDTGFIPLTSPFYIKVMDTILKKCTP